jgi:hypothetical protein
MDRVVLRDGKYEVVQSNSPWRFMALRNGDEWRDLTGDNLVLAMFYKIIDLQEEIEALKTKK